MSDELFLNGKTYVSSKKAAETTGYARDYIGQLARGGNIDAERVGGLWYVSLDSLQSYEKNAESARSFAPVASAKTSESSLTFEGKDYISASRASKITGYNQDYVGQLARGGKIPSRQIGNRWYVDRDALVQHKAEKDALLAAVQSESVGLHPKQLVQEAPIQAEEAPVVAAPQLTYTREVVDLIPVIAEKDADKPRPAYPMSNFAEIRPKANQVMLKSSIQEEKQASAMKTMPFTPPSIPRKRSRRRVTGAAVAALTIIIVLSVGIAGLKGNATFATVRQSPQMQAMTASAANTVGSIGDVIENIVSPLLVYNRGQ